MSTPEDVLAVTVLIALDKPSLFDAETKHAARELIRGGCPWTRVAAFLLASRTAA